MKIRLGKADHNWMFGIAWIDKGLYLGFWIYIKFQTFGHIILSGGEPIAHPDFYKILELCKKHTQDVVVYSNAINHLIYNSNVIDGVYLETNITILPEVDRVHILRRVKQGREKVRPEVHLSKNFLVSCSKCGHNVLRPDGTLSKTPCDKWSCEC